MLNIPTTTQAAFEDLIDFTLRARGVDPASFLPAFRDFYKGHEPRTPDEDFLAELAAAKREQIEHIASEKRQAVNGTIPGPLVAAHICKTYARIVRLREAELRCPIYLGQN